MNKVKVIILAAGQGQRLAPITHDIPKCMVCVGGMAILEWQLVAFEKIDNLEEIIIVTGYKAEIVETFIKNRESRIKVTLVCNKHYQTTENIYSLWLALKKIGDAPFFLINGDIIISDDIVKNLSAAEYHYVVLDPSQYIEKDMKVGCTALGQYQFGIDIPKKLSKGVAIMTFFSMDLRRELSQFVAHFHDKKVHYEIALNEYWKQYAIFLKSTKAPWIEIDNLDDLEKAKNMMHNNVLKR